MRRAAGVGNLIQAGIWGVVAAWLYGGWRPAGLLAGVAALAQILGGLALVAGRGPRAARLGSAISLGIAVVVLSFYAHAASILASRFGAEAKDIGLAGLGAAAAALPWLVAFPIWQLLAGREGARSGAGQASILLLVAGGLGWGAASWDARPATTWPAQPELLAAAQGAYDRWSGKAEAPLPAGAGPATVLLTPWQAGVPGSSVRGEGQDLSAAVSAALARLPAPGPDRPALVLDVARARWEGSTVLGPDGGELGEKADRSPTTLWRPATISRGQALPGLWVPRPRQKGRATRFDSALVDASGARALRQGWPAAPTLTADAAREAALASGRMLVYHQDAQGRYAYIISGPSGREVGGYNFPRHAGASWFLARLAERTGDPEIAAGAKRALDYLADTSTSLPDGSAYVRDPTRQDRKVWVGTTALAVLAAVSAGHEMALPWGRFVAASVDDAGQVLGEMDLNKGQFLPQDQNSYGQGQAMLALAVLVRAGNEEFRAPLVRAMNFVDGRYAPISADRLISLDEHWMCLAALAERDAVGRAAGVEICRAYVHGSRFDTPTAGSAVHLGTGAAGGLAEAVVAAALLEPGAPWRERALSFARLFLESAFHEADAPLLERPQALLGGFRDTAGDWDVRMDAQQHIGCALLGAEALLEAPHPGSLP